LFSPGGDWTLSDIVRQYDRESESLNLTPNFLLSFICISALLIPSSLTAGAEISEVRADEYGVYSTLIREYSGPEILADTLAVFVVHQLTEDDKLSHPGGLQHIVDSGGGLSLQELRRIGLGMNIKVNPIDDSTMTQVAGSAVMTELVGEFTRLNAAPDTLKGPFPGLRRVALLSASDAEAIGDSAVRGRIGYYEILEKRFPHSHGKWSFSRAAMNQTKDYALVYVGHRGGLFAGAGRLVLLRKVDGVWKIAKVEKQWIS
jgi:hypothetical protein